MVSTGVGSPARQMSFVALARTFLEHFPLRHSPLHMVTADLVSVLAHNATMLDRQFGSLEIPSLVQAL